MNPLDNILNQAIDNLQKHNELAAAKATIDKAADTIGCLQVQLDDQAKQIKQLESKVSALREAGDDLWYCLRHRNEDSSYAISEWTEVRDV
jgi:predicted  nucleic acid-binding Zn-ribbon protein